MDVNRANRYIFSYEVYETVPEFDNSSHSKSYLDMGLDIFSLSKRQGVASFKYSDVKKVRIVQEEMTFEVCFYSYLSLPIMTFAYYFSCLYTINLF